MESNPDKRALRLVFAAGDGGSAGAALPQALEHLLASSSVQFIAVAGPNPGALGADEILAAGIRSACSELGAEERLLLAGYSRGARLSAQLAAELGAQAWLGFGYPFHAPRESIDRARVAQLSQVRLPGLLCQGERDPHGNRDQVRGYGLPAELRLHWIPAVRHALGPEQLAQLEVRRALGVAADFVRALLQGP
jgi:predicted alpha/beta-hydrolase family hydrolase